ncbi:MAG: TonB-dependent receptor [Rhizomicrobium sp.]
MTFKKLLWSGVSAASLVLVAGAAFGQDSDTMETVVVSGVRASLATSLEIKKNATQFVDSIVSQDIGKLPDNTIIDAMQHITGVQVQHASGAGETGTFLIHGLPDIATTINGRQIFTTTGRTISLADIPAELLSRVDIHKSAEANDLEGGIAGLVNAQFRRPLDFDGAMVAGGLNGTYSSQAKHVDPDASLLLSDRWKTKVGDVGVLFDVSYNKRHYLDFDAFNYYFGNSATLGGVTAKTPETLGAISYPGSRERIGSNLSTQWRPTENTEVYAEVFYTRYRNNNEVNYLIGLPGKGTGVSALTTVTDPDGNTVMKSETASDLFQLTSNQSYRDKTDTVQVSTGASWTDEKLTLSTEVNITYSKYHRQGVILDTGVYVPLSFDTNYNNSGTPNITLADSSYESTLMDGASYHPTQFYDQWTRSSGSETDWKTDGSYTFGETGIKSVDFGVRYANRFGKNRADNGGVLSCYNSASSYSQADTQYAAEVAAARSEACGYVSDSSSEWWTVSMEDILPGSMSASRGSFMKGATDWGVRKWMTVNGKYAMSHIKDIRAAFGQSTDEPDADPSNTFGDREITWSGYGKVNYGFDVFDMPLSGNVGMRVVETKSTLNAYDYSLEMTDTNSDGVYDVYTKTYTPVTTKKDIVDWMPSLNTKLAVRDDLAVRLAIGRTVTRPTFAQLNPAQSLSSGGLTYAATGSSGNPDLAPVKSNNFDLGLEYYFGTQNSVTASVFYRQIIGYVQTNTTTEVIDGTSYTMSKPQNGGQGFLQGLELSYTQFYDFLPGFWSGLGLQANATFIEGHTETSATDTERVPYTNVSKYSWNLIGIYERGPFSMRAAYNWRSSFLVAYTLSDATSINPASAYAKPYGTLDFSASYDLKETGLTFTIDATNLTGEIYRDTFGKGSYADVYPRDTRSFDQTIQIGVRYKMN